MVSGAHQVIREMHSTFVVKLLCISCRNVREVTEGEEDERTYQGFTRTEQGNHERTICSP